MQQSVLEEETSKVREEIHALEIQSAALERALDSKNALLAKTPRVSLAQAIKALAEADEKTLAQFNITHYFLPGQELTLESLYGPEQRTQFVVALIARLQAPDDALTLEVARAARNCLREASASNAPLTSRLNTLFFPRIESSSAAIRDECIKCINNSLLKNPDARQALMSSGSYPNCLAVFAQRLQPGKSSNAEAAKMCSSFMTMFSGPPSDEVIAKDMVEFLIPSLLRRLSSALQECLDLTSHQVRASTLSGGFESKSRAGLLVDGLRVVYAVAVYASEPMLKALMANEGKAPMQGQALFDARLDNDQLGVGDLYVFLLLAVIQAESALDNEVLDKVKRQVCSLLMFADRAPGFVQFLQLHGVARNMSDLLERSIDGLESHKGHAHDLLLPALAGLHSLLGESPDFVDDFKVLWLSSLLDELDPNEYKDEEEWKKAVERRHFQGHSRPGSVFGKLVSLLQSFDDHTKRFAGEIIWKVCDEDAKTVTHHAGFGHAAHLLAIKGGMIEQILAQQEKRLTGGGGGGGGDSS